MLWFTMFIITICAVFELVSKHFFALLGKRLSKAVIFVVCSQKQINWSKLAEKELRQIGLRRNNMER